MSTLANSDLFIVQRPSGMDSGTYKIEWESVLDNIAASPAVQFKGTANFTSAADDPSGNGEGRDNGDLWVNTTDGTFAWANPETASKAVLEGDYCIWDADDGVWRFIGSVGGGGGAVDSVDANTPLSTVGGATEGDVVLQIKMASFSDGSTYVREFPLGTEPGVVASIALDSDVAAGDDPSPNPNAVVTAAQLKATNDALDTATAGGISGLTAVQDPNPPARWTASDYEGTSYDGDVSSLGVTQLQPTASGSARTLAVSLADTGTPGVFLAPVDDDVNPANADSDEADGKLSKVHAVTPNLVYEFYTPRNFNLLSELP